jgi:flavin reductase (DIM6/NTAB) family NADH-FMN oxidoreductase RutF
MNASRTEIAADRFDCRIFSLINNRLLLGTGAWRAGEAKPGQPLPYNAMTISWGMMGTVWNRPMVQVLIRPQRHSFSLISGSDSFTVGVLPKALEGAHQVFGAKSGRDLNKFEATGIQAEASQRVAAPSFVQAELMIECHIVYHSRLKPEGFMADWIAPHYKDDYHYLYWGEVAGIFKTAD